jgi:hypothetical protein
MPPQSKDGEEIRKLLFLDLMMIAFGGVEGRDNKVIFKNLKQRDEHLTFKITDKTVDMHKTIEATSNRQKKEYQPIARIGLDLERLRNHLAQYENMPVSEGVKLLGLTEVDMRSPEYAGKKIVPLSNAAFSKAERKNRRTVSVTSLSHLPLYSIDELEQINFKVGFIPSDSEKLRLPEEVLVRDNDSGKFYTMKMPDRKGLENLLTRIGIDGKQFLKDVPTLPYKSTFS